MPSRLGRMPPTVTEMGMKTEFTQKPPFCGHSDWLTGQAHDESQSKWTPPQDFAADSWERVSFACSSKAMSVGVWGCWWPSWPSQQENLTETQPWRHSPHEILSPWPCLKQVVSCFPIMCCKNVFTFSLSTLNWFSVTYKQKNLKYIEKNSLYILDQFHCSYVKLV